MLDGAKETLYNANGKYGINFERDETNKATAQAGNYEVQYNLQKLLYTDMSLHKEKEDKFSASRTRR